MRSLVAALSLLLVPPALAQGPGDRPTPLAPGARALLFAVGPNLSFGALDGGTLGIKWHRSEERALRLGTTVAAFGGVQNGTVDTNQQSVSVGVTLVPLRYRRTGTPIYLYTGIGPMAQVSVRRSDAEGQDGQWSSLVEAGAVGVVGVEWVVAEAIGLTGEYGQSLTVGASFAADEEYRVMFAPRGARLGVSVYF